MLGDHHVADGEVDRCNHPDGSGDCGQPSDLFRPMSDDQKRQLMDDIAEAMAGVPAAIVKRQIGHFYKADPDYGIGVATRMGLSAADLPETRAAE